MKFNENSKIIPLKKLELSDEEIRSLYIPKKYDSIKESITCYQKEYYYYKSVTANLLINELLGSYLAKKVGLDTVDYKIGEMQNQIYVLSKIFYEPDYSYSDFRSYYGEIQFLDLSFYQTLMSFFYLSKFELLNKIKSSELVKSILKLTALDLKMGQFDRHNKNLLLKINQNNDVNLVSQFDYGGSYPIKGTPYLIYDNPAIILRKNKKSLLAFSESFPEFVDYVSLLYHIPIDDAMKDIENEKLIEFDSEEMYFYQKQDIENNKILRKILY